MINPETLFSFLNNLVLVVWLLMIIVPKWKFTQFIVSNFIVVILISVFYGAIIISNFGAVDFMDFTSLQGIMKMLQSSDAWGSSALWYHFLAFDLFVGTWILKDSQKTFIPHLLVIPCLLFTFMLGPIGFVLYQIMKFGYTRINKSKMKSA